MASSLLLPIRSVMQRGRGRSRRAVRLARLSGNSRRWLPAAAGALDPSAGFRPALALLLAPLIIWAAFRIRVRWTVAALSLLSLGVAVATWLPSLLAAVGGWRKCWIFGELILTLSLQELRCCSEHRLRLRSTWLGRRWCGPASGCFRGLGRSPFQNGSPAVAQTWPRCRCWRGGSSQVSCFMRSSTWPAPWCSPTVRTGLRGRKPRWLYPSAS
jgi:hypothetical protein